MEARPYGIVPCTEGPIGSRIERYRARAESLRNIADDVIVENLRQTLLKIANTYEEMAQQAARMH